jgi:hypothetical protein
MLSGIAKYNVTVVSASSLYFIESNERKVQFHQPPEMKEKVKVLGMESLDFDGCSELWLNSIDDWDKFASDKGNVKLFGDSGT